MSLCITTVVSADDYQTYIPIFIYTVKRAYPEYYVKIFLRGKLNALIRGVLEDMKKLKYCDPGWEVLEKRFMNFPKRTSICNTLRHLLPEEEFKRFDYLYITDIDFIVFRHSPTLLEYLSSRIKKTKQPYAAARGPYQYPRRYEINRTGWKGNFTRISDGMLMLKIPEWFNATKKARKKYAKLVASSTPDGFDNHVPATYREYNEVMLYRICVKSKLKTPKRKNKFIDDKGFKKLYRDIHLGDFKFSRRNRQYKWIKPENFFNFDDLCQDPVWQTLLKRLNGTIAVRMVKKAAEYVRKFHHEAGKRYKRPERRELPAEVHKEPEKTDSGVESNTDSGRTTG
ncbi:MAG TPA: hypothetical protein VMZ04_10765 [Anaerolineae bacterium]|nr:hypothetical protein [Anaerolineae bacterium]